MDIYLTILAVCFKIVAIITVFAISVGLSAGVLWCVLYPISMLAGKFGVKAKSKFGMESVDNSESFQVWIFIVLCVLMMPLGFFITHKAYVDLDLGGNNKPRVKVVDDIVLDRFILVSQTTPKHYYVTLKHQKFGSVYEQQYVSKHCNNYQDNKPGTSYNLKVKTWHYEDTPESKFIEFVNLQSEFCGS